MYGEWRPSLAASKSKKNVAVGASNAGANSKKPQLRYDATFTILSNVWAEDPNKWAEYFNHLSPLMGELATALQTVVEGSTSLEQARNRVRRLMNTTRPAYFPYGPNTTSIDRIAETLFPSRYYAVGKQSCTGCGYVDPRDYGILESYMSAGLSSQQDYPHGVEMKDWMNAYLSKERGACAVCQGNGGYCRLTMTSTLRDVPPIVLLDLDHESLIMSEKLSFICDGAAVPAPELKERLDWGQMTRTVTVSKGSWGESKSHKNGGGREPKRGCKGRTARPRHKREQPRNCSENSVAVRCRYRSSRHGGAWNIFELVWAEGYGPHHGKVSVDRQVSGCTCAHVWERYTATSPPDA
ncbi:hypothetical protein C8F04DRAFT_1185277 [Mycena alexandri]|uniref:Uncharacterized protein n=1 Tax=Mycena alexandri TaxID=1745969 RepID=A0AAD6SQP1_9AGAR|nr:hypothetical protein C8F04DRAFT_1185277 [Mycena alexandri]